MVTSAHILRFNLFNTHSTYPILHSRNTNGTFCHDGFRRSVAGYYILIIRSFIARISTLIFGEGMTLECASVVGTMRSELAEGSEMERGWQWMKE